MMSESQREQFRLCEKAVVSLEPQVFLRYPERLSQLTSSNIFHQIFRINLINLFCPSYIIYLTHGMTAMVIVFSKINLIINKCEFISLLGLRRRPLKVSVRFVLQHSSHISELLYQHNRCDNNKINITPLLPCELFVPFFLIFCNHRLQINKILRGKILFITFLLCKSKELLNISFHPQPRQQRLCYGVRFYFLSRK